MSQAQFVVRDAPALGPEGKRYALECPHGSTSAVLLPGRSALSNPVVLDLLVARHDRAYECRCSRALGPRMTHPARA